MSWFRENLGLKVFSLIFALLLEMYLYGPNNLAGLEIPGSVEIRNLAPSKMVVWPPGTDSNGASVRIKLRGPTHLIEQLKSSAWPIFVDLPVPSPDRYRVVFNHDSLQLPSGVEVIDIRPSSLEFVFETVVKRELTVVPRIVGDVKDGFEVAQVRVYPIKVLARGPRNELRDKGSIDTATVDVSGWDRTERREVQLSDWDGLTVLGLNFVTVEVEVRPKTATRKFAHLPLEVVVSEGLAASITNTKIDLTVVGEAELVGSLTASQLKVVADCRGLGAGQFNVPVTTSQLPDGIEVKGYTPSSVTVRIVAKDSTT